MFEVKPAPGIKISRIAGLSDDLALALKAAAVRIEAPIPGRDTVGVEIPNPTRQTVFLREVMESRAFQDSPSLLTFALGKDIFGRPQVADLARMPHLLVAGATGQGKSVCLNTILVSFLYKARPEDVRLLLVDPKRIELSIYEDLPHLVHPVVTETALAKNALEWAVHEMEVRYEAMARIGVRNIEGYNRKLRAERSSLPEDFAEARPLPYLVIVIDEMADLMLTARKEVETSVVRLAQLARAAGMHMILATQRPSVDVVTGLIKANFPSRIAFTVTSPQDSRTIIDTVGANHLLGKGDMLFKPGGGKLVRLHGALVDEEEIARVTGWWKERADPAYDLDFGTWNPDAATGGGGGSEDLAGEGIPDDPVYPEAVAFVMEQGKASISLIQRRFRIGFNRAARFVEQMEQDGVVGRADGAKPRSVLKGRE
jgi:S-DNA-T family DNA segregation ATPase FtsK/SpoIIIE